MIVKTTRSLDGISSSSRIDEYRSDWSDKQARESHRIAPAPTKVAAVLWLTKVAVRFPWYASFGAHNSRFGVKTSAAMP